MQVQDLLELLETCDPEAEVRLMTQPNYPIECEVYGAVRSLDIAQVERAVRSLGSAQVESDEPPTDEDIPDIVYIVEGNQIGYGKRSAWQ